MTALRFLREYCGLTGTKEGCGEGDCGACTIAVGERKDGRVVYRAVNSCLYPAARLHGKHVVTIEGLVSGDTLHPIQRAVLDHHATQCGFCTPGVIMSLFCLFSERSKPTDAEIKDALEGNLCRCTGYESILDAARSVKGLGIPAHLQEAARLLEKLPMRADSTGAMPGDWPMNEYHLPGSFEKLFEALDAVGNGHECKIVSGGTDLIVAVNVLGKRFNRVFDISGIPGLSEIRRSDGHVSVGALVTFADLLEDGEVKAYLPALHAAASMGSAQIRNVATLAGNVANASPVADGSVALLALGARLILRSASGSRTVPLDQFFLGYKKTALGEREIIETIEIPLMWTHSSFVKSSKRESVDIASVSSAVALKIEGGRIALVRVSLGGVAPFPVLAEKAAAVLIGKTPSESVFADAGRAAMAEVTPISDVRGSAEYRKLLVRNQMLVHWRRMSGDSGTAPTRGAATMG
jgi:xanthine dehydrogenase small subunit